MIEPPTPRPLPRTVIHTSFINDKSVGKGTIDFEDGGNYKGTLDWDLHSHGRGTMRYANGDVYEGEFYKGRRHGRVNTPASYYIILYHTISYYIILYNLRDMPSFTMEVATTENGRTICQTGLERCIW